MLAHRLLPGYVVSARTDADVPSRGNKFCARGSDAVASRMPTEHGATNTVYCDFRKRGAGGEDVRIGSQVLELARQLALLQRLLTGGRDTRETLR